MKKPVFTYKDRKVIKLLLENPDIKIYKYCCKQFSFWRVCNNNDINFVYSAPKNILNKLEDMGIIISDLSELEFKVQYALGVAKDYLYYIPKDARKILEKLFDEETL